MGRYKQAQSEVVGQHTYMKAVREAKQRKHLGSAVQVSSKLKDEENVLKRI